jgi:hypothetical protein
MPRNRTNIAGQTRLAASRRDGPQIAGQTSPAEDLPYAVELWTLSRDAVERVLARASSASLAQAIFLAAQTEHLGRRITLRHGHEVIATRE